MIEKVCYNVCDRSGRLCYLLRRKLQSQFICQIGALRMASEADAAARQAVTLLACLLSYITLDEPTSFGDAAEASGFRLLNGILRGG